MEKINFINNSTPALNAANLNKLQQNTENAIQEVQDDTDAKVPKSDIKTSRTTSDTATYSCNFTNDLIKYSTEETIVGIGENDKPIYRKVIAVSSIDCSTAGYKFVAHGINNLKNVINCKYIFNYENISSSYRNNTYNSVITAFDFNNTNIRFYTNAWEMVNNWRFILEYTKTTD